jgi:amino-acid N-acetyltransferase
MKARIARASDVSSVHRLISHYAGEGLLLPRVEDEIHSHISRFIVLVEKRNGAEKLLGCVALEPYCGNLAEIRSLAVSPEARGKHKGVGDHLMKAAMDTARRRKIARLFAVTHRPDFFLRHGFEQGPRQMVPEKITRDCATCPKEPHCDLVALVAVVCPERDLLHVLEDAEKALAIR